MLGLQTVSFFTALLVIGSGYALFDVAVAGSVEIAYYTVMFAALFAALVSGVECVCLLVRLTLHGPIPRTRKSFDDSKARDNCVKPSGGPRQALSRARLAAPHAGEM